VDEHKDEFEAESARRPLQRFFQEYVDQEPVASFRSELVRLELEPVSNLERTVATRSLVRYGRQGVADDSLKTCANEDWVRLFIALRRACLPDTRITPGLLREWKTKVTSSIVVMRQCYIVELAALDALPQYPPDLDKWIIPKDELVLPVDIYSGRTLIIDDGYDRANLNVPGVLHIECAAKLSQERPSQALRGRPSGFTSHLHPEALDDCVLPNPLPPNHPNIPQRAVVPAHPPLPRDQAQNVAGMRHYKYEDTHVEKDDPKRALQDIFVNAMKGVEAKRWVSSDIAQPNTVELWVRIFQIHMCHNVSTPDMSFT
jgi:hypothetical protein